MAVVLYKLENNEIKSIRVQPERFRSHLDLGWQLEKPGEQEISVEEKSAMERVEIDILKGKDNLDPGEVRRLAREKGVDGWEKKRIGTLIDELKQ